VTPIRLFFRHCPGCGRRFEIQLVSKKLIRVDRETSTIPEIESLATVGPTHSVPLTLSEGRPITVDTEEFEYSYKCGHCGHEWSEKRDVESLER